MSGYRQAVFRAAGAVEIVEVQRAELGPRDVLLRVTACGVCGSDVGSYLHGHYVKPGQVMGHEMAGRVIAVGAEVELGPGTLVAVRPLRTCGRCWYCARGDAHLCGRSAARSLAYGLAGGFAEEVLVPDAVIGRDVVPVPEHVDPEDLLWAEPLAVAIRAITLSAASAGDQALVVGAGSVGLCVIGALIAGGVRVDVVEPRPVRRAAAEVLGARTVTADEVATGRHDAVFEASGASGGLATAARAAERAPLVLLGLSDRPIPVEAAHADLRGAFAYLDRDFHRAISLIVDGRVSMRAAVSHRFPLDETGAAIRASATDETAVKVLVVPTTEPAEQPQPCAA
ncbi:MULTISPECIES: alcohol dehydrogenase catalytic domain-containing protein [unclassified Micromonospora]|uniref:zinc-dependent alcohol dehydrogenase n=1 Tax=unclassified Micromonospora TaxID=2617518 RepID=UPI0022B74047|nr:MULTISPECIES: alcohol dehydrogenase catalytic domain-containing protein [unclassified Micromonospora]MCZ7422147.1 alcohol dehydrogenase catalytic domain-containing protein [Verrucosispora sp. WMMA2121]WBB89884.1 alcohol dehydrogenase catalytic domain-containing protein [Verrucosispora sp. WMMC514]